MRAKNNDGKGEGWTGQREVNWDEGIDNRCGSDNHHSQVEFGNEGVDDYQDNWGDQTSDVRYAGEPIDPQVI